MARVEAALGPWAHYQAARPALWEGKLDDVMADMAVIEGSGLHGPVVDARLLTLSAGVAALEGRSAEAVQRYSDALIAWRAVDMVWEEALTGLDSVTLLDPALPQVAAIGDSTRQILERLGARPYLDRLETVLARKVAERAESPDATVEAEVAASAS
jgi:hypothetical protein